MRAGLEGKVLDGAHATANFRCNFVWCGFIVGQCAAKTSMAPRIEMGLVGRARFIWILELF